MFPKGTVFVVGAGASCEFGFPVGLELAQSIPSLIDFRWSRNQMVGTGNDGVLRALTVLADNDPEVRNEFTKACGRIREGLPLALSIDNFIHQHSHDAYIAAPAKVAIVKSIIDAENNSKIYVDRRSGPDSFDFSPILDTWFVSFMRYLNAGVTDKMEALKKISFIVFNYDRAVEHLIYNGIKKSWSLNFEDAATLANSVKIIHPYGSVGPLPWQNNTNGIGFGDIERQDLAAISKRILTFTEQINDKKTRNDIDNTIKDASSIIFLGFAYYKQNMIVLQAENDRLVQSFGTVYGMSESDARHVRNSISFHMGISNPKITLEKLTCSDFFSQYGRSLADI